MQRKDTKLDLIREKFEGIISGLETMTDEKKVYHEAEYWIFKELLLLGQLLLQYFTGTLIMRDKQKNKDRANMKLKNCGLKKRTVITIFGKIKITRNKFYDREKQQVVYPFDAENKILPGKFSCTLQDWIGKTATENTFNESVSQINKILNLDLKAMQSERISEQLTKKVELFYNQKEYSTQIEGEYFAIAFDDKGVPIRAGSLGRETESNGVRLGKGQKRDTKRHSTVSVSYSFNKRCRTPEDVISSLFKENKDKIVEPFEKQTIAQHKHIRAFMGDKEKAIEYGFQQIFKRNDGTTKPIVVLIDGDRGLEHAVNRVAQQLKSTERIEAKVLDFIHVTEYLWKAANVHFGEKSTLRESWVKLQCKLILESQTETVIKTIEHILNEHKGNSGKVRDLESVIKYLGNHKHMMDYATYLKKGFPISTGAVESACGHFVQNRMERNGMHWTLNGAQNILDLRAVSKNNDWEEFMKFHIDSQYKAVA